MIITCARCTQPIWELVEDQVMGTRFMGNMFRNMPNYEWYEPDPNESGLDLICPQCENSFLDDQHRIRTMRGEFLAIDQLGATIITTADGSPFKSEQAAKMFAGRKKLGLFQIVPQGDGFVISTHGSHDMNGASTQ